MSEVNKEYAQALYELSEDEGKVEEYLCEVRAIADILSQNPKYIRLLSAPDIAQRERIGILDECFFGRCEEYILSFMKLMVERGYAEHIKGCFLEFERIYNDRHGIAVAHVKTAVPLSEETKAALTAKLEAYSKKKVELKFTLVPTLIGGISVELDGVLLEGSVKARLDRLRSDMSNITI